MKWKKIIIKTKAENEALVSDMLVEKGFEGIEILDNKQLSPEDAAKMFIDIPPELDESDETATVSCYFDVDEDSEEKLVLVREGIDELSYFMDVSDIEISLSETEDKDWMNNWKEFFKPFRIDDTIVIKPTWEELSDSKPDDMVIEIDPGSAFGTGAHETTKLCILALKKYMGICGEAGLNNGKLRVLDVGCGSGILSIAAKILGADGVFGTDIDENAVVVSYENAEVNKLETVKSGEYESGKLSFLTGNLIDDEGLRNRIGLHSFGIVVANILADIIMPLSDVVRDMMADNALFISSGILATREKEVSERLVANGFEIVEVLHLGDWVSIVAK
ncbi:MAG: 50S ribosomal protein L11 methyltransferase [Lachnospiraceae bacterium]|nr:50S ribosomal protein L11 methyltransferase [Lachnospiraceae bacterium]